MSKKGELSITAYEFYCNVFRLKDKELIQELINETEIRRLKKENTSSISERYRRMYIFWKQESQEDISWT